jgi:hypothetical protein
MAKAHTLIDNFNGASMNSALWVSYGVPSSPDRIRQINGRLEIRPAGNVAGYSGYNSISTFDLTSSEVKVELIQALRPVSGTDAKLSVFTPTGDNLIRISVEDRTVSCVETSSPSGSQTDMVHASAPYDEVQHRWLRIRELRGLVYCEASPDGETWTTLVSFTPDPGFSLATIHASIAAGTWKPVVYPGVAIFDNCNVPDCRPARRVEERRRSARDVRIEAAELAARHPHREHHNNNDEVNDLTRPFVGNYSKSLKHDNLGDPDPVSYGSLLRALQSEDPADFEEIQLASTSAIKLTNPQAGLTFDVGGPDPQALTIPPAPRFDSEVAAHEAGELYWMAVARDVPFINYGTDSIIAAAASSLNNEFPQFGGTTPVSAQNIFRGIYVGEQVGPYVSQFLLKGNIDQRKPDGLGRDANEGFISYGARVIDQRIIPAAAGVDHLITFNSWLDAQNGVDTRGQGTFDTQRRFIRNLRDGATLVHFDQVIDAYYNAAWILTSEPSGNQLTFQSGTTGRPQIDLEFPKDQGNPYDPPGTAGDSKTQIGFATFGPIHLFQVLSEVLGRALRAVWWQKWGVHRRLRPEEYGGRVHNHITGARTYPLHASIRNSLQTGGLAPYYGDSGDRFPSYLLPQAYSEGAPTHPAYGAGHATGSGACATILKAFFDDTKAIENPLQASADGLSLVPYTGADAGQMTVGSELNKLAGNIALFRDAAGVHWRSDYTESILLGEAVAIRLLQEMTLGFNEEGAFFQLTRFDGRTIRIAEGKVALVS